MSLMQAAEDELLLRESGWWERLCEVIPELVLMTGTPQPPEHHAEGDVAIHTRMAIENCPDNCDPDLLWIALLHDIGKPATTRLQSHGRITAHGHAKSGAVIAEEILKRLSFPAERIKRITWVIRHHIFHHSWQLKAAKNLTNKQRNYLINPDFPLLLEFLRIDSTASIGSTDGTQAYEFYKNLWLAETR